MERRLSCRNGCLPEYRTTQMIELLIRAESKVGELRGKSVSNPRMLIRAHLKREAVPSSRIEGTMASLEDLNMQEALGNISFQDSHHMRLIEVQNYVKALEYALGRIRTAGCRLDLDLILGAHKILMDGVRGGDKSPGVLRTTQNVIALLGTGRIVHVPPPPETVRDLLNDLWMFVHTANGTSALIKSAIAHYQFEAIRPFSDGNGRIGRLLIPLIMHTSGVLTQPLLYVSAYLEAHRGEYHERLHRVSKSSDWNSWIKFFLVAFAEQADATIRGLEGLDSLKRGYADRLSAQNARASALVLLDGLFDNPYTTIPRAAKQLDVSYVGAASAIRSLADAGILQETEIKARAKVFLARGIEDALS